MPSVAFRELRTLWFQLTGTLCNLACHHCLNASGPRTPWLVGLGAEEVRRHLADAVALGVKEIYFTGGEPFLHPELFLMAAGVRCVQGNYDRSVGLGLTDCGCGYTDPGHSR